MSALLSSAPLMAQAAPTAPGAASAASPNGPGSTQANKVTSVEGITEYRLPNGLRVLLFPDQTRGTVLVNMTYLVGSRVEGYGETGMAHLLEHMLFKGTPTRPNVWKMLEDKGANFNGSTSWDRTNYFEELPASTESLDFALALEADRMVNSKIAGEDLAKEFSVVRNEFERGENNPSGILEEKVLAAAFQWHNYGKSTIGSRSDIERVPIENLRAFYRKYYQPDNAVLIVAGKFEPATALELISKHFGPIARPSRQLVPSWTVEPVQDGERQVTLRRTGDVAVVTLAYHGVAGADPDHDTEDAVADILTNKPSGRLYKALVAKGLASEVSGDVYPMAEPGVLVLSARVAAGVSPEKVRDTMVATVESLGSNKITSDEIERWRAAWMRQFDLILNETARTGQVLSEYIAMGDWRLLFLSRDRVKAITAADVERVARAFLKPSNRTLGMFLPTKAPDRAPAVSMPDVAALVKDYKGAAAVAEGEAFAPTFDNIEKRTSRDRLEEGLQLALLPKKTKGSSVRLVLNVRFGSETDLKGKTTAAAVLPEMLMRGTKAHSFQQLKDQLDRLRAEVHFGSGRLSPSTINVSQVRVKTTRDNLPAVLSLLTEILRQPAFSKGELGALRKEMISHLEEQLQDPMANGMVAVMQKLFPFAKTDVRYVASIKENIAHIEKLEPSDLAKLHKALWGVSSAQLAVVGDFDTATVRQQIARELGAWKAPKPYQRITSPFRQSETAELVVNTPDKEMGFITVAKTLELRDDDPAYPALTMFNYLLGGSTTARLFDRLRQKEGMSYGAGSTIFAHPIDRSGHFMAWAICAPQNIDKAMAAMKEEIAKLMKDGVTEKELADAKQSYAKGWDSNLADDDFISGELAQGLFLGRTFEHWRALNEKIQKLTPDDIKSVAQRFIDPSQLVEVRAGDMSKRAGL